RTVGSTKYKNSFYNPAMLAYLTSLNISATYIPMDYEESINSIILRYPTRSYGFVFYYSNFISKGIEEWDITNTFQGTNTYKEDSFSLGVGRTYESKLLEDKTIDVGFRLNKNNARLGSENIYSSFSFDLGFNIILEQNLGVGLSLLNLLDPDHQKICLGFNKFYHLDWYVSLIRPNIGYTEISVGMEHKIKDDFRVRFALDNSFVEDKTDFLSAVKIGFSFLFNKFKKFKPLNDFQLDYAFSKRGDLGFIHYLTISYLYKTINKEEIFESEEEIKERGRIDLAKDEYKFIPFSVRVSCFGEESVRPLLYKYLSKYKQISLLDGEMDSKLLHSMGTENIDIYKSREPLDYHIMVVSYLIQDKGEFTLTLDFINIYTQKILYTNIRTFYKKKDLEYHARGLVEQFYLDNKQMLKQGIYKLERQRQIELANRSSQK
ncbi:hypothetical protein ACFL5N_02655, partial [bacterium]